MSIIAAGTTTTTALSSTGNTDGTLQFQVNGTTPSVTLNTLGAIGVGSTPSFGTAGQVLTSGGSTVAPTWATPSAGGSAATPTALGTVYGSQTTSGGTPFLTAYGYNAGRDNTGARNVFIGRDAGLSNVAGTDSIAIGYEALQDYSGTDGLNIAIGSYALTSALTGSVYHNVAIGYESMKLNTSGYNNTAVGHRTLASNTSGRNSVAIGYNALRFLETGNDGSTAVGSDSLTAVTTGVYNVGCGGSTGSTITTGSYNTLMGYGALGGGSNTTSSSNVAIGYNAMATAGVKSNNVAIGKNSLFATTTGGNNVAIGLDALFNNTTSSGNTAVGYQAVANGTGDGTTGLGYRAGYNLTTGYGNTAIGYSAMFSSTSLRHSTGIGYEALKNATTGVGNTMIQPYSSTETYQPAFNITTESNRISMGSTTVSNAYIQVAWTAVSDARDKMNFAPVTHGLDFVNQLNPVSYQFKETRESDVPHGPVRYGFKAQEVLELEGANPVIINNEDSEKLRMTDTYMIPVLVKAIQELKAEFDAYKASHP